MTKGLLNKFIVLILLVAAIVMYWPSHNLISFLSQNDLGLFLYGSQRILDGDVPYRGFVAYGPLMPYYYALFFKLFGVHFTSVILGKILLNILSGFLVYFSLRMFIAPVMAVIAVIWFWAFNLEFQHTYNHAGGVLVILLLSYLLLRYIKDAQQKWIYCIGLSSLALLLIKPNIGLALLVAVALSVILINCAEKKPLRETSHAIMVLTAAFLISVVIYGFLILGLPGYYAKECFPWLPGSNAFQYSASIFDPFMNLWGMFIDNLKGPSSERWNSLSMFPGFWAFRVFTGFFLITIGSAIYYLLKKEFRDDLDKKFWLSLSIMLLLLVFLMHEFVLAYSSYNIYWASPSFILLIFFIAGTVYRSWVLLFRKLIIFSLILTVCFEIQGRYLFKERISKYPGQFLSDEKLGVYVQNPQNWIDTVTKTTAYLRTHLQLNETFFAIPYDPLYYYLTDKPSPTLDLQLLEFTHIPPKEEERIITDLERKKVNYILLSNRGNGSEPSMGTFGKTYCPVLAQYIKDHFQEVEMIGDWSHSTAYIFGHAVKIYKRIPK